MSKTIFVEYEYLKSLPEMVDFLRYIGSLGVVLVDVDPKHYAVKVPFVFKEIQGNARYSSKIIPVLNGRDHHLYMFKPRDIFVTTHERRARIWVEEGGMSVLTTSLSYRQVKDFIDRNY